MNRGVPLLRPLGISHAGWVLSHMCHLHSFLMFQIVGWENTKGLGRSLELSLAL
jgi:hypothetical protein